MSALRTEAVELQVIRQSFRCFWLGVFGLVPGVGVALAWQSLTLFNKLSAGAGEKPRASFPLALFVGALVLNPLLHVGLPDFSDLLATILLILVFVAWTWVGYSRSRPKRWNPARNWAWAGAMLGAIGFAVTILAAEFLYVSAYGRFLRGLP